jgi:tRNA G18 (ribose-2'-O)-methylase SpoU
MKREAKSKEVYLIVHNIRSAGNVGSLFRTADAAGITKIYLTGYTPHPLDRFGRRQKDLAKTALGAERTVPWEGARDALRLIDRLKRSGVQVIAIEQGTEAIDYRACKPRFPVAFVVGNEVRGLSQALCARCDVIAEIPQAGKKESLNVAVAAGVALFRILHP